MIVAEVLTWCIDCQLSRKLFFKLHNRFFKEIISMITIPQVLTKYVLNKILVFFAFIEANGMEHCLSILLKPDMDTLLKQ